MTTIRYSRPAHGALYAGLGLAVIAALVPSLDHLGPNLIANHIRVGYPGYSQAAIDTGATTYLIYLSVVGVLGVGCWLWTIRAVRAGKRWVRWVAPPLFLIASSIALFNLLIRDTSGDTGIAPPIGAIGLLPCVAGLIAVVLLWRRSHGRRNSVTPPSPMLEQGASGKVDNEKAGDQ